VAPQIFVGRSIIPVLQKSSSAPTWPQTLNIHEARTGNGVDSEPKNVVGCWRRLIKLSVSAPASLWQ